MPAPAPLLVIEPDPTRLSSALELLARERFPVQLVSNGREALAALANDYFEVVLLDLDLPDQQGLETLARIRAEPAAPEVVVITDQGSVTTAVEAMRKGAYDFLMQPAAPERVLIAARNAAEHRRLSGAVAMLKKQTIVSGFIGDAPVMQSVYKMIESAAASKASVFITGESGTGKDVCANAIHAKSSRAGRALVAINCAAIPRELMESEIFGHVKGAFTGASTDREGAARQADGIGQALRQRVQHLRPVRVHHALGTTGGARGVAHGDRVVLVALRIVPVTGGGADEGLVVDVAVRHRLAGERHDDDLLDGR